MARVLLSDSTLRSAAESGPDAFFNCVVDAIAASVGGELTADTMEQLSADQITLWAFRMMHEEVMDGGFIQLIHNGYGEFFFQNPFGKVLKLWGLRDLSKLVYDARKLFFEFGTEIAAECTDEEFMALYERFPQFDDLDDAFVEGEEEWTRQLAFYVDEHLSDFVEIENQADGKEQ